MNILSGAVGVILLKFSGNGDVSLLRDTLLLTTKYKCDPFNEQSVRTVVGDLLLMV